MKAQRAISVNTPWVWIKLIATIVVYDCVRFVCAFIVLYRQKVKPWFSTHFLYRFAHGKLN